ncbi:ABC transporter permease [Puia sp.]|jgi:predicted permease|uniref:ABC transporter permease n=1 Tax=Puia sp. TaxID=2045100 RepID=UPI002F40967E
MWKNYLTIAWRTMTRHKLYTAINVIGLAIGICSCLAIWTITHYELSFDTFHPDSERIYRLVNTHNQLAGEEAHWPNLSEPAAAQIRKEITGLETVAQFHNYNASVTIPGNHGQQKKIPKAISGENKNDLIFAEPHYFDIFKYEWIAGNPAALERPFQIVLTASAVERYFGTRDYPAAMGRTLIYDDSITVTVAGIIKDWNKTTDFTFKDIISYATIKATGLKNEFQEDNWDSFNSSSQAFVKLAKGVTPARVEAQLIPFANKYFIGFTKEDRFRVHLQPFSAIHFDSVYGKDYGTEANLPTLYGLMGIALFILVLASINFINLSTAQSLRRAKEIGIRKVLGSRRAGLIVQFLGETTLLVLISLLLSLALLYPALSAFPNFVPAAAKAYVFTPATIVFGLAVLLLTSLLSGFYPAWILSSFIPAKTLKNQGAPGRSIRNRLGKGLVVFQFTISIVFIISTIAVGNQLHYLLNKDMGFARNAIIRFDVNGKDSLNRRYLLRDRIARLPGVARVSLDYCAPVLGGWWKTTIDYKGAHPYKGNINVRAADTNYIPLYELRLLAGRNLQPSDTAKELVINNTYAQLLGFRQPQQAIGVMLPFWDHQMPIVGVVADFNQRSLQFAIEPTVITSYTPSQDSYSVKLQTGGTASAGWRQTIKNIEQTYKSVFPDEAFTYAFLDENIAKFYGKEKKTAQLVNLSMAITIMISCMGLFGLAALTAEQRTREIGIRKVLGARVGNITTMLSRDFLILVVIALVISSPIAWYFIHGWLQDYSYRTNISWWIFALAGVSAVAIALLTVGFHAVRAALANPVKALRSE